MKTLFILNDLSYGAERCYNALLEVSLDPAHLVSYMREPENRSIACFRKGIQRRRLHLDCEKGVADGAEEALMAISLAGERWRAERPS